MKMPFFVRGSNFRSLLPLDYPSFRFGSGMYRIVAPKGNLIAVDGCSVSQFVSRLIFSDHVRDVPSEAISYEGVVPPMVAKTGSIEDSSATLDGTAHGSLGYSVRLWSIECSRVVVPHHRLGGAFMLLKPSE